MILIFVLTLYVCVYKDNRHFQKPFVVRSFFSGSDRLKSLMPRYIGDHLDFIPIWILSLQSLSIRREHVEKNMRNITYEFIDGLEVDEFFPVDELQQLFAGPRMWFAKRGDLFARKKISVDYGHIRALLKLCSSGNEVALILEDDADIDPAINVQEELFKILKKVPMDWDIIYLTEIGNHRTSDIEAANGVKILRSTSCTLAYMVTRKAAFTILREIFSNKCHLNIDLLYSELIKDGAMNAYLVLPGIVNRSKIVGGSSMDYDNGIKNPLYRMMTSNFG